MIYCMSGERDNNNGARLVLHNGELLTFLSVTISGGVARTP